MSEEKADQPSRAPTFGDAVNKLPLEYRNVVLTYLKGLGDVGLAIIEHPIEFFKSFKDFDA